MLWKKKSKGGEPAEARPEERDAAEPVDRSLDVLTALIKLYGKYAFDTDQANAGDTEAQCNEWATRIALGTTRAQGQAQRKIHGDCFGVLYIQVARHLTQGETDLVGVLDPGIQPEGGPAERPVWSRTENAQLGLRAGRLGKAEGDDPETGERGATNHCRRQDDCWTDHAFSAERAKLNRRRQKPTGSCSLEMRRQPNHPFPPG